jgi:predicted RNA-binding Zn-ribbon protein involved in translation (DUF1610 family)
MARTTCVSCGALIEYDDKSVWEGCRDFESVNCPHCGAYVTRVFTDGVPCPRVVVAPDLKTVPPSRHNNPDC